jgi:hypothetical protein
MILGLLMKLSCPDDLCHHPIQVSIAFPGGSLQNSHGKKTLYTVSSY